MIPAWSHLLIRGSRVAVVMLLASAPLVAERSGTGAGSVSLPSGPGSVEGLGNSFQASLNTGTASHSIPITPGPAIGGLAPSLKLTYDGGHGNGILGPGWSFGAGFIQRRIEKGLPRYVDGPNGIDEDLDSVVDNPEEVDVFLDAGGEELIPVVDPLDPKATNYFPRVGGSFIRHRRVGNHWESDLPGGGRLVFGRSPEARIAHPDDATKVYQWLMESESDMNGNTIEYRYSGAPGASNLNERFLVEVRHGAGPAPWSHFHFMVFTYEDRPDWTEDCRSGFPIRLGRRLSRIDVGTQGVVIQGHAQGDFNRDGVSDVLTRSYVLGYQADSFRSLLASITRIGADGVTAFPPITYSYTQDSLDETISAAGAQISSVNEPPVSFESALVEMTDINGDGLPDLIRSQPAGGGHLGFINQGQRGDGQRAIHWGAPIEVAPGDDGMASMADLSDPGTHLADLDGDGLVDLVQVGVDAVYRYRSEPGGSGVGPRWGNRKRVEIQEVAPPSPYGDPDVRTADMDFDKRLDIIKSIRVGDSVAYQIWFNVRGEQYSDRVTVQPARGFHFGDSGVQIADFNGDRLQDICRIRASSVEVINAYGRGVFSEPVRVSFPEGEVLTDDQISRAYLQDVNGDGLADLVVDRPEPATVWFWANQGNQTLASRRRIIGLPPALGTVRYRWADLNGNGTTDLVVSDDGSVPKLSAIDLGELLGCVPRRHLLREIRNGRGSVTRMEYASSTQFALADGTNEEGVYAYPWAHPLPFPVDVVTRRTVSDSLGTTEETRFAYHDGYYNPEEKQFRGFRRAEEYTIGDAEAPTLVSRVQFDVGDTSLALKGRMLSTSQELMDGRVFTRTTNRWEVHTFAKGTGGAVSLWAGLAESAKSTLEGGAGEPRHVETTYRYDNFGNPTEVNEWGFVDSGNRLAGNDERVTRTIYAINTNRWLLRFPARVTLSDAAGRVLARTDHFYDDESFSGNNPGVVTVGRSTLVRRWHDVGRPDGYILAERTRHDAYGNTIFSYDPLGDPAHPDRGHHHEFRHDPEFHQFPTHTLRHVGNGKPALVVRTTFNPAFGNLISLTDENGFVTRRSHDPFGRITKNVQPGDSEAYPTHEFSYGDGIPLGGGRLINYVETRSLDTVPGSIPGLTRIDHYLISRTYADGLGRSRLSKLEAEPGEGTARPRFVASGAHTINRRGWVSSRLAPWFSPTMDFEDIQEEGWRGEVHLEGNYATRGLREIPRIRFTYDALGRTVVSTHPDGAFRRTEFQPHIVRVFHEKRTDPTSSFFGEHHAEHSDGLGRTIRIDEATRLDDEGRPTPDIQVWASHYRYRADDVLLSITDSQGNRKSMTYDALGRRTSMEDWDKGRSTFEYDDGSNMVLSADARGQRVAMTYDGLNRVLTEDFIAEGGGAFSYGMEPEVRYTYDLLPNPVDLGNGSTSVVTNALGRLIQIHDTAGDATMAYDHRGRISWKVRRLLDPVHGQPVAYRTAWEYDSMDRLVRMIYPDEDEVVYGYNRRGLLTSISGGPNGRILSTRSYTPSAQTERTILGNGVSHRYAYDARMRLITAQAGSPGHQDDLLAHRFQYDPESNVMAIEDFRPAAVVPPGDPRRNTQRFTYDGLDRITGYWVSHAAPGAPSREDGTVRFRYDRIGNLLEQTSKWPGNAALESATSIGSLSYGGSLGRYNRTAVGEGQPGPHALTGIQGGGLSRSVSYDASGNMVRDEAGQRLVWDARNRLVRHAGAQGIADYRYDHSGRRLSRKITTDEGGRQRSIHHLYVDPAFEVRPNDELVKYVFDGSDRLAQITGTLTRSNRLQHIRIHSGWNLACLTMDVPDLHRALFSKANQGIDAARIWDPASRGFHPLAPGATAARGSVVWLHSTVTGKLALPGIESSRLPWAIGSGNGFLPILGPVPRAMKDLMPQGSTLWSFAPESDTWDIHHGFVGSVVSQPSALAPGSVLFVTTEHRIQLPATSVSPRIRYYIDDHLGSQAAVTDEDGSLTEETAYLPFGESRHHHQVTSDTVPYRFGGKERDTESGLHYFEARYLAGSLARFATPDPVEHHGTPQLFNGYSFVGNRPMVSTDPTGLIPTQGRSRASSRSIQSRHSTDMDLVGGTTASIAPILAQSSPMLSSSGVGNKQSGLLGGLSGAGRAGISSAAGSVRSTASSQYGVLPEAIRGQKFVDDYESTSDAIGGSKPEPVPLSQYARVSMRSQYDRVSQHSQYGAIPRDPLKAGSGPYAVHPDLLKDVSGRSRQYLTMGATMDGGASHGQYLTMGASMDGGLSQGQYLTMGSPLGTEPTSSARNPNGPGGSGFRTQGAPPPRIQEQSYVLRYFLWPDLQGKVDPVKSR